LKYIGHFNFSTTAVRQIFDQDYHPSQVLAYYIEECHTFINIFSETKFKYRRSESYKNVARKCIYSTIKLFQVEKVAAATKVDQEISCIIL